MEREEEGRDGRQEEAGEGTAERTEFPGVGPISHHTFPCVTVGSWFVRLSGHLFLLSED